MLRSSTTVPQRWSHHQVGLSCAIGPAGSSCGRGRSHAAPSPAVEAGKDSVALRITFAILPTPRVLDVGAPLLARLASGLRLWAFHLDSTFGCTGDFDYDYFGFKTLERSYLLKMNGEVVRAVEEAPPQPLPNAAAHWPLGSLQLKRRPQRRGSLPGLPESCARVRESPPPLHRAACFEALLQVVERPQQMLMRVALGIHLRDIDSAIET